MPAFKRIEAKLVHSLTQFKLSFLNYLNCVTDKSCESCDLHSRSRWQNGIGGDEFAGSKVVWVSNTDWKGHISKTITCVPLEVVVCVFYSEFTSLLFYN